MRGPLHRLTVGNYIDAQLGILTSVSYTIPNDSPWEISLDEPEGGKGQLILPHIIEVSMNFTPIGAETGFNSAGTGSVSNKIEEKTKKTSFIAQNTTGKDVPTIQYYDGFKPPASSPTPIYYTNKYPKSSLPTPSETLDNLLVPTDEGL
jgi:hypothetical protein